MKLSEGHYHEICDRSNIISEMIDACLIEAYKGGDAFVMKKAKAAQKLINEIYQHAGARF